MAGVNKVILVGVLGKDPEIKHNQSGDPIANMSIATSETWRDKQSGECKEKTEWHRISVFGGLAKIVEQYLHKGSKCYISGKLQTRKWQDNNGNDRYTTEVVVSGFGGELVMLDGKSSGQQAQGQQHQGTQYDQAQAPQGNVGADLDDEIPF